MKINITYIYDINANEINKNVEKLSALNPDQREALLSIIDSKINNDMEKILLRMDSNTKELNTKIDSIKWFILSSVGLISLIIATFK
ncbi:MAG: hypothetical protein EAZ27_08015 [Cytophagales bacterium]|nr:MAG: hypothetical protein EAZ27_08015 [Cytophagales bacterium]